MTGTLPAVVQQVFESFITTEFTTIDASGQPITWPVTPYYRAGAVSIDVSTGLGYPKKADDAARNPHVSLLFSDPTGCGMDKPPMVLVQGTAEVDDDDLDANRERYFRESGEKLPATKKMHPPAFVRKQLGWYYTRIYVRVRPERVYVWPDASCEAEPELLDAHMEEVRSGRDQEPERADVSAPTGAAAVWDARLEALGSRTYPTAVLAVVGPDGFPFSMRLPVTPDEQSRCIRFDCDIPALPLRPSRACLVAHLHSEQFAWQSNFQVRGDFVQQGEDWVFVPQKFVGGFVVPRGRIPMMREMIGRTLKHRSKAKAELAKRSGSRSGSR